MVKDMCKLASTCNKNVLLYFKMDKHLDRWLIGNGFWIGKKLEKLYYCAYIGHTGVSVINGDTYHVGKSCLH